MLPTNPKYHTLNNAVILREQARQQGQKVVLTNGCFDLLHTGHLAFLHDAAQRGDALWIAINTDASVRQLKGPTRPVLNADERAYALAALACVTGVFSFGTSRLNNEILAFKPDVYVKAGDYTLDSLDPSEREALQKVGTKIEFLPFLEGYSTTQLIQRIDAAAKTF